MHHQQLTIQRALLSVSDKTGIVEFAHSLAQHGIELLSTGGTAELLLEKGLTVTEVSEYTGFPEIMAGRVKTLHPKIHGGILGRRGIDDDVMAKQEILPIDLVVTNLYPFEATISKNNCSLEEAIENIDIGGPAMIRAAAKNYQYVSVVTSPEDYAALITELESSQGALTASTRFMLAKKAFQHTANYDNVIANYFAAIPTTDINHSLAITQDPSSTEQFPSLLNLQYRKKQGLRYGENSHQQAAFYIEENVTDASIATAQQLQGKPLSYNNIADADAALECVKSFNSPACVIVKHANPCGVATASTILEAYQLAYQTDPVSAFGGIIAFNHAIDAETAQKILANQFVEVIIAPAVQQEAITILQKKPNIRILASGQWHTPEMSYEVKSVTGGLLMQQRDLDLLTPTNFTVVTQRQPTQQELADATFGWKVVKFVKSNAIVYARDSRTIGIGAGQMSRVYSARIASIKAADAGLTVTNSIMASDAFFPFRDGVDAAATAGVTCIIQPGGSINDDQVIAAANEHNMAMIFTHFRHFRH